MQNQPHRVRSAARAKSRRKEFDSNLNAYARAGKAAIAAGVAVGSTAIAPGQVIHTLTASSFSASPVSAITPVGNSAPGRHSFGQSFQVTPFGNTIDLIVKQANFYGTKSYNSVNYTWVNTQKKAYGSARVQAVGLPRLRFAAVAGPGGFSPLKFAPGAPINETVGGSWAANSAQVLNTRGTASTNAAHYPVGNVVGTANFVNGQAGYMGFRLQKSVGNYYFGWLRIEFTKDADNRPLSLQFVADSGGVYGAYGDLNAPILAGAGGTPTAIPEPASVAAGLALFALGAAGIREHRRRRQAAA